MGIPIKELGARVSCMVTGYLSGRTAGISMAGMLTGRRLGLGCLSTPMEVCMLGIGKMGNRMGKAIRIRTVKRQT